MKTIKSISLIFVLLISILLVGCNSNNRIVGEWVYYNSETKSMKFYEDGTYEISGEYGSGTYLVDSNNMLKLTGYYGDVQTFEYIEFSDLDKATRMSWCINDDKLYIGGADNYYIKK